MLELESSVLANQHFSESHNAEPADETLTPHDAFDPAAYFERWFADVHADGQQGQRQTHEGKEIYFESSRGSKCEVNFEGVLHFDGYTMGNIRSPEGTLVLAKAGRVEADIDVCKAVISGSVTGNINAPEGVVLDSDARVTGRIHTRVLSVRVGALFEGDCLLAVGPGSNGKEKSSGVEALNNTNVGIARDRSRGAVASSKR